MIDDPAKTDIFISKLKSALPIDAGLTKELLHLLATKSPEIPIQARCQVIDVLNLGDDGGVACCLDSGGPETTAAHIVNGVHATISARIRQYRLRSFSRPT